MDESQKSQRVKLKHRLVNHISRSGITLMQTKTLQSLLNEQRKYKSVLSEIELLKKYGLEVNSPFLECHQLSKSQLRQDMWIAIASGFKRNGTFVEVGAADGVTLSNTFMLEKVLSWRGVLVEPSEFWHRKLRENRNSRIDTRCCMSQSGLMVDFFAARDPLLSTIARNRFSDTHASERIKGSTSKVLSVSLNDIFEEYKLPNKIDYLSIDTEGNEFEILEKFNFKKFSFGFATIENGFNKEKSRQIQELLEFYGYSKVHEDLSEFDDFYVRNSNAR